MDPNEALRLIRAHIKQLRVEDKTREDGWIGRLTQQARDLSEAFEALDEWLSRDGFLPDDWRSDDEKAAAATASVPTIYTDAYGTTTQEIYDAARKANVSPMDYDNLVDDHGRTNYPAILKAIKEMKR